MWTGPNIAATIISAAALIWGVVSFFIARSARSAADGASTNAMSAGVRAAEALEKANQLTEKLLAPPPAPWALTRQDGGNQWAIHNHTGHVVPEAWWSPANGAFEDATGTVGPVDPDGMIQIRAVKPFTVASLTVHWIDATSNQHDLALTVRP